MWTPKSSYWQRMLTIWLIVFSRWIVKDCVTICFKKCRSCVTGLWPRSSKWVNTLRRRHLNLVKKFTTLATKSITYTSSKTVKFNLSFTIWSSTREATQWANMKSVATLQTKLWDARCELSGMGANSGSKRWSSVRRKGCSGLKSLGLSASKSSTWARNTGLSSCRQMMYRHT